MPLLEVDPPPNVGLLAGGGVEVAGFGGVLDPPLNFGCEEEELLLDPPLNLGGEVEVPLNLGEELPPLNLGLLLLLPLLLPDLDPAYVGVAKNKQHITVIPIKFLNIFSPMGTALLSV